MNLYPFCSWADQLEIFEEPILLEDVRDSNSRWTFQPESCQKRVDPVVGSIG